MSDDATTRPYSKGEGMQRRHERSKGTRVLSMIRAGFTLKDAAAQVEMTENAARTALGRRGFLYRGGELVACEPWSRS